MLDLSQYPDSCEAHIHIRRLCEVPPPSVDDLAAKIGNVFWWATTLESTVSCPRCDTDGMRILEYASGEMALCCVICDWSQTAAGEERSERLWVPTSAALERWSVRL